MKYFRTIELIIVALTMALSSVVAIPPEDPEVLQVINVEANTTSIKPVEQKLSELDKELEEMSEEQYVLLLTILHYGEKYELGITLAAISWQESGLGRFNMNLADGKYGSFGPFHILLDYAAIRHNKNTDWGRSRLAEKLMSDIEFSIEEAVGVLKKFKNSNCNSTCALARYNGGYDKKNKERAAKYAKSVEARKVAIVKYLERHYTEMKIASIQRFGSEKAKLALNEAWSIPDFNTLYAATE